ncbi:prepilin-type N-terminal cleavage/methylation domain-containing protein [Trichlorobacter ammonificans]|uniref:General secretion pathway protein H n=1 Tax=Trichlorobacter ammonificans TaxID=2916410 RepID=A0ABM9D8K7_9BACT|nr:prepilin-type N-terminal cleavage/methylation domain-containing protein [Trichlorobacter ammonificans]CAH2031547.1 General secretion pathway protein H [Trichlorobacter ammonificans]
MNRYGCSGSGFTLLELVVVLAILSLVVLLVIPRLPALGDTALRTSTRQLAAQLRYLDERAAAGKVSHRLRINLDDQKIEVVRRAVTGEELPSEDPYLRRPALLDGVLITDVRTERLGTVTSGTVRVTYGPGGLSEALLIHLQLPGGPATTVQALPVSGIVRIAEGYLEELR